MGVIVALAQDPARGDDGLLCQLEDGRVFLTLAGSMREYAEEADETALPAVNRAWERAPSLFAGPLTPRVPVVPAQSAGIAADLTVEDRARLYRIIRKHRRAYFAPGVEPSIAQMDNLIDGLGARTAEKIVRSAVDHGKL